MNEKIAIHWFKRDLRLDDNSALFHALKSGFKIVPIFIFDNVILEDLKVENKNLTFDKRLIFIHQTLVELKNKLLLLGSDLWVFYGNPLSVWKEIIEKHNPNAVFTNHDYESYAIQRDEQITNLLAEKKCPFYSFKDQCIFEKGEIVKQDGKPYTIFTPYSKKWKEKLNAFYLKSYPCSQYFQNFFKTEKQNQMISLNEMGFEDIETNFPPLEISDNLINNYETTRNFPAQQGTSKLSIHLRFGTISIRKIAQQSFYSTNPTFLNELIWRDFYMMILWHFPNVINSSFKPEYDNIKWLNQESDFKKWCDGNTGYPIVDAGMRELNNTGFMHNRVRMIVASFLTKHLLIDWRWGEAYFAKKLLDYELSSNNGGWQWAAGSGCDAAPYFRIFSPKAQTEKFDSELKYIRYWVPELDTFDYPLPIVNHEFARNRCMETYKVALKKT